MNQPVSHDCSGSFQIFCLPPGLGLNPSVQLLLDACLNRSFPSTQALLIATLISGWPGRTILGKRAIFQSPALVDETIQGTSKNPNSVAMLRCSINFNATYQTYAAR